MEQGLLTPTGLALRGGSGKVQGPPGQDLFLQRPQPHHCRVCLWIPAAHTPSSLLISSVCPEPLNEALYEEPGAW